MTPASALSGWYLKPIRISRCGVRHADRQIVRAAFGIAEKTSRTVYDSLYLALADRIGGQVVTADDRFVNALAGTPWAHLIIPLRKIP